MSYKSDSYKRLGDYIKEVDIRNRDLQCTKLLGLSIAKTFIPSIANTVGTDFRPYKIVKHNQFAYVPVTSRNGDKITVALYDGEEDCIISQAYISFEIKDTSKLLPEYLMIWFRRPEFDRYARFKSHGSAREVFDWEEMCNVLMPIPDIKEQKRIVYQYNAIQNRIETNKQTIVKLEETAQAIYRKMFIDNIDLEDLPDGWEKGTLSEIATINMGQSPAGNTLNKQGNGILFYQGCTDFGIRFVAPRVYTTAPTKFAEPYDILISVRAPVGSLNITKEQCCIGRGLAAIKATCESQSFVFYTLKNQTQAFSVADDEGSIFGSINKDGLKNLSIVIPPKSLIKEYDKLVSPIDKLIIHYESEINILQDTLSVIL